MYPSPYLEQCLRQPKGRSEAEEISASFSSKAADQLTKRKKHTTIMRKGNVKTASSLRAHTLDIFKVSPPTRIVMVDASSLRRLSTESAGSAQTRRNIPYDFGRWKAGFCSTRCQRYHGGRGRVWFVQCGRVRDKQTLFTIGYRGTVEVFAQCRFAIHIYSHGGRMGVLQFLAETHDYVAAVSVTHYAHRTVPRSMKRERHLGE